MFSSLLRTFEPKKFQYELGLFGNIENPVRWAYNLCLSNARSGALTLQAMKSAFANNAGIAEDEAIYIDINNATAVEGVLRGIAGAYAGHARFEIIYCDNVTGFCWYPPVENFYREMFMDALNQINPLGHYVQATLWFSALKHIYEAHTDLADGFLFQMMGTKRVKVWELADEHRDAAIFNNDAAYRQSLPYKEFELNAGDVLFIPAGAVHEVTVNEGVTSLSLSFHLGGPYPVLALCNDLNAKYEDREFGLQDEYKKTGKPYITLFDPAYGLADKAADCISTELCSKLCELIQSDCSDEELTSFISEWWSEKRTTPSYKGPYKFS